MSRKFSVVTTFHAKGYETYGKKMIETFLKTWPKEVTLHVYAEDCQVLEKADNLIVHDLHKESKRLVEFKEKWKNDPKANGDVRSDPVRSKRRDAGKGFKWHAIRFSHKVYSIFHCAPICNTDILMWMDADMICHSPITIEELDNYCPSEFDVCYLGRKGKFSECGLYSMNLNNVKTWDFLKEFQRFYDQAENGIFTLDEWHDSFVFDAVRDRIKGLRCLDWARGLIEGEGHPLINSHWGKYLDHLKGKRKDYGKSLKTDLVVKRNEDYWR